MENGGIPSPELVLAKRIQQFRQRCGLTQQGLCYKAHLSYSTLAKIERGAIKAPSIFTIIGIAEALGVSIDELVGIKLVRPSRAHVQTDRNLKTSKDGIKFVFFDVNGCLVRFYQKAFLMISSEQGIPAERVEAVYWNYSEKINKGIFSMDQFNAHFAKKLGIDVIDWSKYFLEAVSEVPGMEDLLRIVIQNYRIGLFTNIMPGILEELIKLKKVPDLDYDAIVDSSKTGFIKPEKKAFDFAKQISHVSSRDILLVDDTKPNLIAAERQGWHTLLFDYMHPSESIARVKKILNL